MRANGFGGDVWIEASDLTEEDGYRAALVMLRADRRPTAIFAANDMVCLGALGAARELGIAVPQQLSLIGYDNTYLAKLRELSLSSVDISGREIGRQAADLLLARIADPGRPPTEFLAAPTLAVRGSTAPPAQSVPER